MQKRTESFSHERQELLWKINSRIAESKEKTGDLHGVLILDVDGTLTRPGSMYAIDREAIGVLSEFVSRGGACIFNTGATLGRLERTVLNQLFYHLDEKNSMEIAEKLFQERIFAAPENGSAMCLNMGVDIMENELYFRWQIIHPLEVPTKQKLREVIQKELVPLFDHSKVIGDAPEDLNPRQYILSWKGITNTLDLVETINTTIKPRHPEIDWQHISLKAARKTIDFVHSESGKYNSTKWILKELGSLEGPVLGFGDLGDEFSKVVPTINVNRYKPNEFRIRNMPAMELNRWNLLDQDGYTILGEGKKAVVRNVHSDVEIPVLRNQKGEIIYAKKSTHGYTVPIVNEGGYPVEIKPFLADRNDPGTAVDDAGKGTAWVLKKLMDIGYFSVDRAPCP